MAKNKSWRELREIAAQIKAKQWEPKVEDMFSKGGFTVRDQVRLYKLGIGRQTYRVIGLLLLTTALNISISAQAPTSYGSLSGVLALDRNLGYTRGWGGSFGLHQMFGERDALIAEAGVIKQEKRGFAGGRTWTGSAGYRRYFDRFFAQAEVDVANFNNDTWNKTATRIAAGGGLHDTFSTRRSWERSGTVQAGGYYRW